MSIGGAITWLVACTSVSGGSGDASSRATLGAGERHLAN